MVKLHARKLAQNRLYPRCGGEEKSIDHLFRRCHVSVEMWSELQVSYILNNIHFDVSQWLIWIFSSSSCSQRRLIACGIWALWWDRNIRVHEKKVNIGCAIARFVKTYVAEIQAIENFVSLKQIEEPKWSSYESVPVRIYFDGAFDARNSKSASGAIVKSAIGGILLSNSKIYERVSSPFEAEAIACQHAVMLGVAQGWSEVDILRDALTIIKIRAILEINHFSMLIFLISIT